MPDSKDERLRQFESALIDPNIAKFAPKTHADSAATIAVLLDDLREHAQAMLTTCKELDAIMAAGEDDVRKAAAILMTMATRIK